MAPNYRNDGSVFPERWLSKSGQVALSEPESSACSSGSKPAPAPTPAPVQEQTVEVDRGTELSKTTLKDKADKYVKSHIGGTTYGGYQITTVKIGSSKELTGDDLYAKYSYSGTYDYIDQYGEKQHTTWDMKVKVYKWSKNPDNKEEVTYYY